MSPIHIGIDGNEANVTNRVGSNRYAYEIIKAISNQISANIQITVYLKSQPLADMPVVTNNFNYRVIGPKFAWTQWRLPLDLYLNPNRPDIFYSPGHYAPRYSPIKTVVTIMDVAFLTHPNLFLSFKRGLKQLKDWTSYSVLHANHVFAISQNTKQDVVKHYSKSEDDISVVYPGVDFNRYQPASESDQKQVAQKYQLPDKYLLHLGTLQPRKNIVRLIEAFENLPPKFKTLNLVLAGAKGWLTSEIEAKIATSKKSTKIHQIGYVDQSDIPAMISSAESLLMVGLYEGFGMPAAESLACGTLPVVSNLSSLPEVIGEGGYLVDPYSVSDIKRGIMVSLSESPEKRIHRLKLGQNHIKKFDWQLSASIVLEKLTDLVTSH